MLQGRELGLGRRDFSKWSLDHIAELNKTFCEILGVQNYLVEFLHGVLKSIRRDNQGT